MKVFISWSGDRSKQVAEALHDWLPKVIQAIKPWLSQSDIEKGVRWSTDLASQLSDAKFGLICLTPENLNAPWLMFEAGALSKTINQTHVCPYLYDLDSSQVTGPLVQFQATHADREDTAKLLTTMNHALGEAALSEAHLSQAFDAWWPELEQRLNSIPNIPEAEKLRRSEADMIREAVGILRLLARDLGPVVRALRTARVDDKQVISTATSRGLSTGLAALTRALLADAEGHPQGQLNKGAESDLLPSRSAVDSEA